MDSPLCVLILSSCSMLADMWGSFPRQLCVRQQNSRSDLQSQDFDICRARQTEAVTGLGIVFTAFSFVLRVCDSCFLEKMEVNNVMKSTSGHISDFFPTFGNLCWQALELQLLRNDPESMLSHEEL